MIFLFSKLNLYETRRKAYGHRKSCRFSDRIEMLV